VVASVACGAARESPRVVRDPDHPAQGEIARAGWHYHPDLSYRPAEATRPGPFAHVDFFLLKPGTETEAESLAREHAAIDREVGVRHAREVYLVDDGPDAPMLVQVVHAASRDAYQQEKKSAEALRGDRIRSVYERVTPLLRGTRWVEGGDLGVIDYRVEPIALPDAHGLVTLDYLAFDRATRRLWVPAGNTASVDVIDGSSLRQLTGFATAEFDLKGRRGRLGPSSVTLGDGVAYVGSRADSAISVVDARSLAVVAHVPIASAADGWAAAPDAVVYVATTKELWVTRGAPPMGIPSSDRAITIYDVTTPTTLRASGSLPLRASAEGYTVDAERGLFFTNLEETGETVAIDVRKRAIQSRWRSGCDEPHGVAIARGRGLVFVACSDRVVLLDVAHEGQVLDTLVAGEGVDNIDYDDETHLLFAAAAEGAALTIARVDEPARFVHVATLSTARGTRSAVAGADGDAYLIDPYGGRILRIQTRATR
jgi:hypothetical protein